MSPLVLTYILTALQALPSIIAAGGQLAAEANALSAQLKLFATEKRDPTPEEWAAQATALSSALAQLTAHNARLTAAAKAA
jgi:hypothetical protein